MNRVVKCTTILFHYHFNTYMNWFRLGTTNVSEQRQMFDELSRHIFHHKSSTHWLFVRHVWLVMIQIALVRSLSLTILCHIHTWTF